ncbi:MAG TPA: TRAP transporter TatT component family protein [Pyrinomonadaceae bacterium]|nr:TRAP transporter TatT component family protein [Pyrinomonadaceae bacterium]
MKPRNSYILLTIVITWWALGACSKEKAATGPTEKVKPEAIQQTLTDVEPLFKQREDLEKLRSAVKMLAAVRDANNRNYQVEWTFARYSFFLGKYDPNEDEGEKHLEAGRDAGKIASRLEPNKPEGYFWFGANLGELSKRSPVTVGFKSVGEIKDAMNKVIELQPDYQGASAYDALGQCELATRLKGGDAEKAVEYLEKGSGLAPDNATMRADLAEAYLAVKRDADAKKQIDHVLQMKPNPEYMPEYREAVEKAKKLLKTNF